MSTTRTRMRDRHRDLAVRAIIGGVAYDTETASVVAQSWYDETSEGQLNPQHPYDVGEKLYQNNWDQFFLLIYCEPSDEDAIRIKPRTPGRRRKSP